jgi:hypothetical protein
VQCGWTNMMELTVAFRNSANMPKNGKICDREFDVQRTVHHDIFL